MAQSIYYTANEVMEILGVSRAKAYKVVKQLNEELEAQGYIVLRTENPCANISVYFPDCTSPEYST